MGLTCLVEKIRKKTHFLPSSLSAPVSATVPGRHSGRGHRDHSCPSVSVLELGAWQLHSSLLEWVLAFCMKTVVLKEVQEEKTCPKSWSQGVRERRCEPDPGACFPSHLPGFRMGRVALGAWISPSVALCRTEWRGAVFARGPSQGAPREPGLQEAASGPREQGSGSASSGLQEAVALWSAE